MTYKNPDFLVISGSNVVYRLFRSFQMLSRSPEVEGTDGDLVALIRKAQVMRFMYYHLINIKQKIILCL